MRTIHTASVLGLLCACAMTQNAPPTAPTFNEPSTPGLVLNPGDVHMETAPFADPNPGDQHSATDWEIWTVQPSERVWHATAATGFESVHVHLGDGVFENSHTGFRRLFANSSFLLRARHIDDSGDPTTNTNWAIPIQKISEVIML